MSERSAPTKVLVVDDDPVALTTAQKWLAAAGFEVVVQQGAFGTSRVVLRERPDVVVLDDEMPALSGESLARLLADSPAASSPAIIFHSGKEPGPLDALVRECGAIGAIPKALDGRAFLDAFLTLIERRARQS